MHEYAGFDGTLAFRGVGHSSRFLLLLLLWTAAGPALEWLGL
jgi:hypothetical protein